MPQAATFFAWHVWAASQHPFGQLLALHALPVHIPFVHVCAAAHAGPVPQRQLPVAEQVCPAGQAAHVPPAGPHVVAVSAAHVAPWQQPVAHEVASQTHAPPTQRWPGAHARPLPQTHAPAGEQASDVSGLQATHAPPGGAQAASVRAVQTPFAQQPVGHDVASQPHPVAPHAWPGAHWGLVPQRQSPAAEHAFASPGSQAVQAAPAGPQAAPVGGATHVFPLQQPLGQEVESHVHWLSTQRWPAAHMPLPPPHSQTPALEQRSARAGSQPAHWLPAGPQLLKLRSVHDAPAQHPPGHEPALQSHTPSLQNWPVSQAGTHARPPSFWPPASLPPSPQRPLATHSSYSAPKLQLVPSRSTATVTCFRGAPGERRAPHRRRGARARPGWARPAAPSACR